MQSVCMVNERGYSDEAVENALRGKKSSPVIGYRYDLLNDKGVKIGDLSDGMEYGRISYNEERQIKRTGRFLLNENGLKLARDVNFLRDRLKPWFVLNMGMGGTVEWPLGLFLMEAPELQVTGKVRRRSINAYDMSLTLEQWKFRNRHYIPAKTNYAAAISQILAMAGMIHYDIQPTDKTIEIDKEFPIGTSAQSAVNELLDMINYRSISVDAAGTAWAEPYLPPAQRQAKIFYKADKHSVIAPEFTDNFNIAAVPNVFILVADNVEGGASLRAEFVNNNARSPVSVANRGREIMSYKTIREIADQDALEARVKRIAIEAASAYRMFRFSTLPNPEHGEGDTIYLDIPGVLDAPGKFVETAWDMELKTGGLMTHEAGMAADL